VVQACDGWCMGVTGGAVAVMGGAVAGLLELGQVWCGLVCWPTDGLIVGLGFKYRAVQLVITIGVMELLCNC
jgi:hypothetical protein